MNLDKQILRWEQEIESIGYISDKGSLIEALRKEQNSILLSKLLSLAALSRQGKNKDESLSRRWMEKALQLDPENESAMGFLLQFDWSKMKDVLTTLEFPAIRETDNRTAKKKTAEQYIKICQTFLPDVEEHLQNLQEKMKTTQSMVHQESYSLYQRLYGLLTSARDAVVNLLKAAEDYDESITGVFHTAIHYEDLKSQLMLLENIKQDWKLLFEKQDDLDVPVTPNALDQLNNMIGMEVVKERINAFYRFLKYQKHRKELGYQIKDEMSLNMILTGNPGTGKTTLARLLAKIYHELGVLPREEVIEADRSHLVGAFVGQTEENVRTAVERAVGGVLFIDEAYSLKREGQAGSDYGQTAIDTLVSLMTSREYGGKFAVILAGYPEEMRSFIDANPGLRSRFPMSNLIHLPNYNNKELIRIAEIIASENDYFLTNDAKMELDHRLEQERVDDTFGNARTVRNIVLDAIFKKGAENKSNNEDILQFTLLNKEDFIVSIEVKSEPPSERLDRLIGLDSIKEEMRSLISFVKMQRYRRENGLPAVPIQLHSVFTGNPGTGKTTVAQIYSELLRECGVLKRGHLIVASRADFVAGYVGQTAGKTKKKIREALGGVLFIDEAYSLLSDTAGDFGKEVINTLVDEMTKHNENIVVILAGYPREMDKLLESNPGLRSRFKKFFFFTDYSIDELLAIMESYAAVYEYQVCNPALQRLREVLAGEKVNGNGRFATNLVDEMIQAQAQRLIDHQENADMLEQAMFIDVNDVNRALRKLKIIERKDVSNG
jgi:SpoVK/Ycf46/Vps4 family AAA+-type ATPase